MGLARPAPSTAAHDVTGQQSLSCHTIEPAQRGLHERRCSIPTVMAFAWLRDMAQCQSSMSSGSAKWGSRPSVSLSLPCAAFWCTSIPGDSGVKGSSLIERVSVDQVGGPCQPNSARKRGTTSR
ncbi:hypothetical protein D3C74_337900 [compost metagenome]